MEIKNTISFDEFNAVVTKVINDCFVGNVYSPAYFDISLRTSLISAFVPDFELNDEDNNTLYASVYTNNACEILDEIKEKPQYSRIVEAIENGIIHRTDMITSGGMSMSDLALSQLIDKVREIVEKIGDDLDVESVKKFVESINATQNGLTEEGVVKALFNTGLLGKSK